ncbi:lantibiotic dehydratase [Pseudomonas syringae group genomosp. 3]|uniref:Lantibiotic dehydratase domain protein n=1 Tax=Pseudomonas syringae pv. primulae TaxID=251707 RepID=A0A3M4S4I1_9PSED|nr:lantibiotic dehydratase [Pseudomonas syringae group genomosp. 3]RMR09840.1 Lantibiotic dehydratase domain protein [Pseudomonas syringae pv. primulae]
MESSLYFWLRSTGFAVHHLTRLGKMAALPLLKDFEADYRSLNTLRDGLLEKSISHSPQACRKLIRKLNENLPLQVSDLPEALRDDAVGELALWNERLGRLKQRAEVDQEYAVFLESARQALIDFVDDEDVEQAVFISNPTALTRLQELRQERHARTDSRKKQKLRLAWSYAQRFCSKNDTSSFFGPLAWGRFDRTQVEHVRIMQHGPGWIRERHTFFESWVVQRLVEQLNRQCVDVQFMPLQLNPGCFLNQDTLHLPVNKRRQVSALTARVLGYIQCQSAVAPTLFGLQAELQDVSAGQLRDLIDHLVAQQIVRRGWQISPRERKPVQVLHTFLADARLSDDFRTQWHERLSGLEAIRQDYATGDLAVRIASLDKLNRLLGEAGVDISRESGAMYVGRYPVYEDCSRNIDISLGGALLDQVNADLAPLMRIHQWLIKACARQLHGFYAQVWQRLQAEDEHNPVNFLAFLGAVQPVIAHAEAGIIEELDVVLADAWQQVLSDKHDPEQVQLTHEDIERLIVELNTRLDVRTFSVFGSHFHSPDFLISSTSTDALNQGDYSIILGEVHPGVHTLSQPVAEPFGPFNKEIEREVRQIFDGPRLVLADSPDSYQRSHIDWPLLECYQQLILPSGGGCVPADQCYAAGRARLVMSEGRLRVEDIAGQFSEDLVCVYPTPMHRLGFALAGSVVAKNDRRRIGLGKTLYKRASWWFSPEQLPCSEFSVDKLDDVLAWRAWAVEHGLPRYVFAKIDIEPKPIFIDFDNPLSIDGVSNSMKKAGHVKFSEMCPAPDQLWLEEARGHFCCEIRTTFRDDGVTRDE